MTSTGDRGITIDTDSGKKIFVPFGTLVAGSRSVKIPTDSGKGIAVRLNTSVVGDRCVAVPDASGKLVAITLATGPSWVQQTANGGWTARQFFNNTMCVSLSDDTIILTGGIAAAADYRRDVWKSIDKGASWTQQTATASWSDDGHHCCVALQDGSLIIIGRVQGGGSWYSRVYHSTDQGANWHEHSILSYPWWTVRHHFSCVVLSDGSIVLMGGYLADGSGQRVNDVWRSTDQGVTWTQQKANNSSYWVKRSGHAGIAMTDGSIVLMGGEDQSLNRLNDVWRSTDQGVTWTQQTATAWDSGRVYFGGIINSDDSILVMGGYDNIGARNNEVWKSIDAGVTWTKLNDASWSDRGLFNAVSLTDGSIVIIGGMDKEDNFLNDVWRYA
jgi:hypothetical protein